VGFFDETVDASWLGGPLKVEAATPPPAWIRPPHDVVPVDLPVHCQLARTRDTSVWIAGAGAFPDGLAFRLELRWRDPARLAPPFVPTATGRDGLCLGVQLADGRRVLAQSPQRTSTSLSSPDLALTALATRHAYCWATVDLWLWPQLSGEIVWVFEWRRGRIPEVRGSLPVDALATAGTAAERIWPSTAVADEERFNGRRIARL
jgi:hypothetical protein